MALPVAMIFALAGTGIIYSYYEQVYSRNWKIDYKIAKYKAKLNAQSGIAHASHCYLYSGAFYGGEFNQAITRDIDVNGLYGKGKELNVDNSPSPDPKYMVDFTVNPTKEFNASSGKFNPVAWSEGRAYISRSSSGISIVETDFKDIREKEKNSIVLRDTARIELTLSSSLSDFLYLTDSEKAGGAPFVFNNYPAYQNRREVNFGSTDKFNDLWPNDEPVCDVEVKTNGTFVVSNYTPPCPEFLSTVYIVEDEDGNVNYPDLPAGCDEDDVFLAETPLDTTKTTCLPPDGYDEMKQTIEALHSDSPTSQFILLDATSKLKWVPNYSHRDTLIMTDIEFFEDNGGGIKVKQWWFLMPPYLNANANLGSFEQPYIGLTTNTGLMNTPSANCNGGNPDDYDCCPSNIPIYQCDKYITSMRNFHAKNITSTGAQSFGAQSISNGNPAGSNYYGALDDIVQSTYGFHHYDIAEIHAPGNNWTSQLTNSHLLPEYQDNGFKVFYYNQPTAIYVKGGPVRVHGVYNGRYSVVTDEYTAYHRHAQGTAMGAPKIDTLWNNIWLTDNIVNADRNTVTNSLLDGQPKSVTPYGCSGGSDNVLGLVSGANVYVANTRENGARNNYWQDDIHIHAHIIAFNESFAVHYFQNTLNSIYSNPPYADGQGVAIHGSSGTIDDRGTIFLWGGIVQKFRGYTVRNAPGPYNTNDIGMDKNYNFDCNLKCNFPPLYPPNIESDKCDEESVEEELKDYLVLEYY